MNCQLFLVRLTGAAAIIFAAVSAKAQPESAAKQQFLSATTIPVVYGSQLPQQVGVEQVKVACESLVVRLNRLYPQKFVLKPDSELSISETRKSLVLVGTPGSNTAFGKVVPPRLIVFSESLFSFGQKRYNKENILVAFYPNRQMTGNLVLWVTGTSDEAVATALSIFDFADFKSDWAIYGLLRVWPWFPELLKIREGNFARPDPSSWLFDPNQDYYPPVPEISPPGVRVSEVTQNSFVVEWTSALTDIGMVAFGSKGDYQWQFTEGAYTTRHRVHLKGLLAGTRYHFTVTPPPIALAGYPPGIDYAYATLPPEGWTRFIRLPILVVIYTPIDYLDRTDTALPDNQLSANLTPEEIDQIKRYCNDFRTFFWRNSGAKLDLKLYYLIIPAQRKDYATDLETYLPSIKKRPDDFAGVIFLDPAKEYLNPDSARALDRGQTFGASACGTGTPWKFKNLTYSHFSPVHNQDIRWVLTHQFHHQLERMFFASGYPDYPVNHFDSTEIQGFFGEYYDCVAYFLKHCKPADWFALNRGELVIVRDDDRDGLPDDADVPINNKTFVRIDPDQGRSSRKQKKTLAPSGITNLPADNSWTTLKKLQASNGIVQGVDEVWGGKTAPPDGRDQYPLYQINSDIVRKTPHIDGLVQTGEWDQFATLYDKDLKATLYLNWDDSALYIGAVTSRQALLNIDLDATGNGWFYGRDNYRISIAPEEAVSHTIRDKSGSGKAFVSVKILDRKKTESEILLPAGSNCFYAKDHYAFWSYEIVKPVDLKVACGHSDSSTRLGGLTTSNTWTIELAIPINTVTELIPAENKVFNIKAGFNPAGNSRGIIDMFEPHVLLPCTLR